MKWLVVLLIFVVILAMIAYRYRHQLLMGLQIWRMYQQLKNPKNREVGENKPKSKGDLKDTPLSRCERCGEWSPAAGMLKIGANKYCSTKCLEKASKLKSLVDG